MVQGASARLLREWAALIAVLALVLGPLALSVNRGLGASDSIAVASGTKPFTLCLPGGADPDQPAGGFDCDHCTAAHAFLACAPAATAGLRLKVAHWTGAETQLALRPFPRAPPARGPPTA
jgi:hypothetical protein